jgi:hypothetical protein
VGQHSIDVDKPSNSIPRHCRSADSVARRRRSRFRLPRAEDPSLADLLVIEFPSEAKAEDVREMLLAMQKEYLIELEMPSSR